ncbi:MAG: M50 family metallopeptidase [bacterium]|jgi:stage IV sporulation protein FB
MYAGKIAGIPLRLNIYFLLAAALYAILGLLPEMALVFAIVCLHEIGHILCAQSKGIKVKEIELLPFGGVAKLDNFFSIDPGCETALALAGPLTNLILVAFVLLLRMHPLWRWPFSDLFIRCNLAMAAFNFLPALPLDGGRIYRAQLSRKAGHRAATEKTARLGKAISVALVLAGLYTLYAGLFTPSLFLLAFFLFNGADREQGMAVYIFMRTLAAKKEELSRSGVLPAEHLAAEGDTPVKQVLRYILPQKYHLIVLLNKNGSARTVLTETELLDGLLEYGIDVSVQTVADLVNK